MKKSMKRSRMRSKKVNKQKQKKSRKVRRGGMMPGMMPGMPPMNNSNSNLELSCEEGKLDQGSRHDRGLMKYLCTKYCSSKPTACGGVDEGGIAIQPEPVCMKLKVCPTKERLADVPKNVMALVKEFQEFLNSFSDALKKEPEPKDTSKAEKLKRLKKELKELQKKYKDKLSGLVGAEDIGCSKHLGADLVSAKKTLLNFIDTCKDDKKSMDNSGNAKIRRVKMCASDFGDIISKYDSILETIKNEGLETGGPGLIRRTLKKIVKKIKSKPTIKDELKKHCRLTVELEEEKREEEEWEAEVEASREREAERERQKEEAEQQRRNEETRRQQEEAEREAAREAEREARRQQEEAIRQQQEAEREARRQQEAAELRERETRAKQALRNEEPEIMFNMFATSDKQPKRKRGAK